MMKVENTRTNKNFNTLSTWKLQKILIQENKNLVNNKLKNWKKKKSKELKATRNQRTTIRN